MPHLPSWVSEAEDLALGMAAAIAADKFWNYDAQRLPWSVLQYFKKHEVLGLRIDRDLPYGSFERNAERALRVMNAIALSPKSEEVWRAFERFGTPPPMFVVRLFMEVDSALGDFERVAITTKDLKSSGARIRTLSLKLAEELSNKAVVESLRRVRLVNRDRPRTSATIPSERSCLELAELASGLQALQRIIGQPNSPNAKRLYFLRRVTKWINSRMNTPMRSQVFALASVFFDMDDLTPQSLATLAPVRKKA